MKYREFINAIRRVEYIDVTRYSDGTSRIGGLRKTPPAPKNWLKGHSLQGLKFHTEWYAIWPRKNGLATLKMQNPTEGES